MFRPAVLRLFNYSIAQKCINQTYSCVNNELFQSNSIINQYSIRSYAKGKNKTKVDKGKGKMKAVKIDESLLGEVIDVEKFKSELGQSIDKMKEIFLTQLTLRSSTGAIDNVLVKFEDKKYSVMELGRIIRKDYKTVIVDMSDFPQAIPSVLNAIANSGMNLNPQRDGTSLFVPVPKVTRDYREGLSKNAKAQFIICRDSIHKIQNKYLKSLKNKTKEGLSEDSSIQLSEQVKQLGTMYVEKADKMLVQKQAELLETY